MILISGLKGVLMVLNMCVKFGVQEKSGSPDMGSNGVQNGVFREFLEKFRLYDIDFRAERRSYGP